MTITVECGMCDRPVADQATVCAGCAGRLERALGDVPALVEELEIVLTRQTVYGDRSDAKSRSAETPVPFDVRASEAGWVLRNTLTTWARLVAEERGANGPADDSMATVARWLLGPSVGTRHLEWLRHHEAGAEAVDEITAIVEEVRRLIDRPAQRWYAGKCGCGEELYARPGAVNMACRGCSSEYDVGERRRDLLAAAEDYLLTASEISDALGAWGQPITAERVRKWAQRGRINRRGSDWREHPTYRLGDIIDLIAENQRVSTCATG